MLKKVLFVLVLVLAALSIVIATRPDTYLVSRQTTIAAPPEKVFARINDFRQWKDWSPWARLDPAMKLTFSGPATGTGSVYEWTGNRDVGKGRMTIKDSQPPSKVSIHLEFIEPFASVSDTDFVLEPAPDGTRVTWSMHGGMNFMFKAMCLFMGGMDKMVGPDYEKGLALLKALSEKSN